MAKMKRTAGWDDWKDGQPTDSNPSYGGAHFEQGKGWCNPEGEPIRLSVGHASTHDPARQESNWTNPNVPPGYRRVAMGIECPIPGCEGGVVRYEVNGQRAIWDAGNVYMAKE